MYPPHPDYWTGWEIEDGDRRYHVLHNAAMETGGIARVGPKPGPVIWIDAAGPDEAVEMHLGGWMYGSFDQPDHQRIGLDSNRPAHHFDFGPDRGILRSRMLDQRPERGEGRP